MSKSTISLDRTATISHRYDSRIGKYGDSYDNPRPMLQSQERSYHALYFHLYKDVCPTYDIAS